MDWISTKDQTPLCYQTGEWDGKRSDIVLCVDKNGGIHLAQCYEGFMDGSEFFEWYDKDDFELCVEIVRWVEINKQH